MRGHQPNTKVLGYFQGGNKAEAIFTNSKSGAIFMDNPQQYAERMIDDNRGQSGNIPHSMAALCYNIQLRFET